MKCDRYMRDGRLVCGRRFGDFGRQCCGSDGDRCPECYEQDRVEQIESDYARLAVERDALRAELADIKETHESVMSEPCPGDDRVHCTCVPVLRAEVQTVFRALSKGCAFRGSVITYPDGREERDERSCNAMGIAECDYYTCPILAAEHKGIEFIIPERNSDMEV